MPETLVLHRLARVPLEQRQVLERGGVEHDLGPVLGEDLAERSGVADVGDDGLRVSSSARPSIDSCTACRADSSRSSMTSSAGAKR